MRTTPRASTATPHPAPGVPGPRQAPSAPQPAPTPAPAHDADPIRDRALFAVWSGDPVVVVSSPPGAGKTRLVTGLAEQLTRRAGLDVAVAAQTRAQALDVANRAAAAGAIVTLLGRSGSVTPAGLSPQVDYQSKIGKISGRRRVIVATTARWLHTTGVRNLADVLIVDEAWQMTYADLGGLGVIAGQVALVGDPGQIAPVVTAETRRWARWAAGPHVPAPEGVWAHHSEVVTWLRIPHTWRLGPVTTALLQPFYRDGFTSRRPQSSVYLPHGLAPELTATTVATHPDPSSPALLDATAQRTRELLTDGVVRTDDGERPLDPTDVAVVVPHVEQAAYLSAALHDVPGVLVGTANQLQGLERHAVVVLHPLAGRREVTAFGADPARLCVALSRHRSHATVVTDAATPGVLDQTIAADPGHSAVRLHSTVLDQITS